MYQRPRFALGADHTGMSQALTHAAISHTDATLQAARHFTFLYCHTIIVTLDRTATMPICRTHCIICNVAIALLNMWCCRNATLGVHRPLGSQNMRHDREIESYSPPHRCWPQVNLTLKAVRYNIT